MKNHIDEVIERIINLPFDFSHKNKSIYSLLQESGYFESNNLINEDQIAEMLHKHPQSIDDWLRWSENKRTSSGWYFKKDEKERYGVGHYPDNNFQYMVFADKFQACAAYIKREIDTIKIRPAN